MILAKLQPQRVIASLVQRTEIIKELAENGPHVKLVFVAAPAGYGKSTLINQLKEAREASGDIVSWLSLDANDNDLDTFTGYLLSSVREALVRHDSDNDVDITAYLKASPRQRIGLLFNDIATLGLPVTMVLDDFHALTDDKLLQFVGSLFDGMPNNLSMIIGSRRVPDLEELHLLRAGSQLVQIDKEQLRFSLEESREIIGLTEVDGLSVDNVQRLYEKTEGWVTALQLATLALRTQDNAANFIEDFSGIENCEDTL